MATIPSISRNTRHGVTAWPSYSWRRLGPGGPIVQTVITSARGHEPRERVTARRYPNEHAARADAARLNGAPR